MKQITILRNGTITNAASFESQELLDSWYATHVESFGVHEALVEDTSAALAQAAINESALAFLSQSDWEIVKATELGLEVSPVLKAARAEARAKIVR